MGFRPSDADAGLLFHDDDSGRTWLLVVVEDILIVARTKAEVHGLLSVTDELIFVFDAHDLGDAHFLSISIERDRAKRTPKLSQKRLTSQLVWRSMGLQHTVTARARPCR